MLARLRKQMRWIILSVAIVFGVTILYGIGSQPYRNLMGGRRSEKLEWAMVRGQPIDPVVVQYHILRFSRQLPPTTDLLTRINLEKFALDQAIEFEILRQEAAKHVRLSGDEKKHALEEFLKANGLKDEKALHDVLGQLGFSWPSFQKILEGDLLVEKRRQEIRQQIHILPSDLREVRARHILIKGLGDKSKAKARQILQDIQQGKNFEQLAKQFSDDPGSKDKGGDLGFFATGRMVPEFEKVAFRLKPGQVSDLVKTSFGYHIIKVEETRLRQIPKGTTTTLEAYVRSEKENQTFQKWRADATNGAHSQIVHPLYRALELSSQGQMGEAKRLLLEEDRDETGNRSVRLLLLADLSDRLQKRDEALQFLNQAMAYGASEAGFYLSVAQIAEHMKNKELAGTALRKAALYAAENQDLHKQLANRFQKLGFAIDAARERQTLASLKKRQTLLEELSKKKSK